VPASSWHEGPLGTAGSTEGILAWLVCCVAQIPHKVCSNEINVAEASFPHVVCVYDPWLWYASKGSQALKLRIP
jgi:hypothetical protein